MNPAQYIPETCRKYVTNVHLYGSTYVGLEAMTEDSDLDLLVLPEPSAEFKLIGRLIGQGFTHDGDPSYAEGGFVSLRKDDINLVIVKDREWFDKSITAMELCKRLKVVNKEDRILLHDVVVRGSLFDPLFESFYNPAENTGGLFS